MEKPLNVQQLIDLLEKVEDKTKEVATEGCDCDGDAGSVVEREDDVYISRETM